jgi:DNA-binding transcriptional MocR family regulator
MFELTHEEILEGKADSIRRAVERAIIDDRLKVGEALPTVRSLAANLGINKNTVVAAYRQLQQIGLIVSDGRRGSFVASRATGGAAPNKASTSQRTVSVRDGNPDNAFLPSESDIREAVARMSVSNRLYGEQRNYPAFVEWAREYFLADGVAVNRGIFVSAGALDLIERALNAAGLVSGDLVALEDPGYTSSLSLVRSMGFTPISLLLDEHGVTPVSLAAALNSGVKAVIVSNRAQNPTGVATSKTRAVELSKLAAKARTVLFIDDDHSCLLELAPYHPWHMRNSGAWVTVRSLSKCLGPDYRLAVATGDPETIERLEVRQSVGMGWVSTFIQRLALQLLNSTVVQKKIAAAGVEYRERYATLQAALKRKGFDVAGSAGLNLWVPIGDEREVAERLFDSGWLARPGRDFCIIPQPGIRVTSASMDAQQCLAFVEALMAARNAKSTTLAA